MINALVGQKLSIVSFKPQTTRHRIMGIASGPAFQARGCDVVPKVEEGVAHALSFTLEGQSLSLWVLMCLAKDELGLINFRV